MEACGAKHRFKLLVFHAVINKSQSFTLTDAPRKTTRYRAQVLLKSYNFILIGEMCTRFARFTGWIPSRNGWRRNVFIPSAARILEMDNFADLLSYTSRTAQVYEEERVPLAASPSRGFILQAVARRYFNKKAPTYDASSPQCDWMQADGKRVEVKSAQLRYEGRRWVFRFDNVKTWLFDIAILVLYTPRGLYLVEWDGAKSYSAAGSRTATHGGQITICGSYSQPGWESSLDLLLANKLPGTLLTYIRFEDPEYREILQRQTMTDQVFSGAPLSGISYPLRGQILQNVVRRFEEDKFRTVDPEPERNWMGTLGDLIGLKVFKLLGSKPVCVRPGYAFIESIPKYKAFVVVEYFLLHCLKHPPGMRSSLMIFNS